MTAGTGSLLALEPAQKAAFERDGYLVVRGLYSPHEIAEMRERFNRIVCAPETAHKGLRFSYEPAEELAKRPVDPNNPRGVWLIMDTPLADDYWFDQIREPRIVNIMGDLLGPDVNFFNGKARLKPPGYVNRQGWHQDWPYERHTTPDLAAAIVYLDDTGPGEGATRVVPGSHRRGEWPHDERKSIPDEAVEEPGVELVAQAGDVAFIHVMVVHRAGDNPSERSRSAIINEYKSAAAKPLEYQPLAFNELPLLRGGRRVV
ncbi:MAG TPA: phytanoyl-CoA dioxygenase family protein [Chloroflexota bacterium]|jgi:phytanoyl-CoA hydroxylase|nr:phytanoyl-CoA dioxygenase family protein [Chloroflexota bacterium]